MKKRWCSFFSFFVPSCCLHCQNKLENPFSLICQYCYELIQLDKALLNRCFEKISPAYDLYQNYLEFHTKKLRDFFALNLSLKYLENYQEKLDFVTSYQSLDDKIFTNSSKAFKAIVKKLGEILEKPYLEIFKHKICDEIYRGNRLQEKVFLSSKKKDFLKSKKILVLSFKRLSSELQDEIRGLSESSYFTFLSLF